MLTTIINFWCAIVNLRSH